MNESPLYFISYMLLLAFGVFVFQYLVPRDYLKRGQLSPLIAFFQALLFFVYGGFPYIYLQNDWPAVAVSQIIHVTGMVFIFTGLAFIFYGMFRLGVNRSLGRGTEHLEQSGVYSISRNPQAIACGLYVIGFFLLWPSWYAAGWALLYFVLIHMMVLAEEEHLGRIHGQKYQDYCEEIPRYLRRTKMIWLYLAIFGFISAVFFGLGLHRQPRYIQNFEEEEYSGGDPFMEPDSVVDGLAVYAIGSGEPVLLFPYPHGHTTEPMAQGPLANILSEMGRTVVTFDVPGAYRSTQEPIGDMDEMIRSADETLERLGIQGPVDVVGHSMGGLAALAYAIERPERTRRLVLVASLSGFPAAARWGFPGSAFRVYERDYWRIILWGMRLNGGRDDLALHKKLQNLMARASYYYEAFFTPAVIDADDYEKGIPIRTIWSKNMYGRLSYADRLGEVQAQTLILAGKHDPQAPLPCSEELLQGITDATLIVFEHSGHSPFIEEAPHFVETVDAFLNKEEDAAGGIIK